VAILLISIETILMVDTSEELEDTIHMDMGSNHIILMEEMVIVDIVTTIIIPSIQDLMLFYKYII